MDPALSVLTPQRIATEAFTDAPAAVVRLDEIYERNTHFLRDCFEAHRSRLLCSAPRASTIRCTAFTTTGSACIHANSEALPRSHSSSFSEPARLRTSSAHSVTEKA
jgi:hypothetical protein